MTLVSPCWLVKDSFSVKSTLAVKCSFICIFMFSLLPLQNSMIFSPFLEGSCKNIVWSLFNSLPFKSIIFKLSLIDQMLWIIASICLSLIISEHTLVIRPIRININSSSMSLTVDKWTNVKRSIRFQVFVKSIRNCLIVDRLFL